MRLHDWPERLAALIERARTMPFTWGQFDCCIFGCMAVEAVTGRDPVIGLAGSYSTRLGAGRWLVERGYDGLAAALDDIVSARQPALMAQRGDLVLVESQTLGVVDLTGIRVACLGEERGLEFVPLKIGIASWHVK